MNSLIDLLGRRIKNASAIQLYSLAIGFTAFLYLINFKFEGPWHWDDLTYIYSILRSYFYPLLLARTGFCYPFIGLWSLVKNFENFNFYFIENLILYLNMLWLTLSYVLTFRILIAVKVPAKVAFISVLLLISELSFTILGNRYNDTPLMLFCVLGSFYLFILAHENRSYRLLLASGFVAGYSILVREPAIFYGLLFVAGFFWFKKRNMNFSLKQYFVTVVLLSVVSISGPLLLYLYYGSQFTDTVVKSMSVYIFDDGMRSKLLVFLNSQVNLLLVALAAIGSFFMYQKMKLYWLLTFVLVTLAPIIVFISVSGNEAVVEPRFHFSYFLLVATGTAFLITAVSDFLKNRTAGVSVLVLLTAGLMYSGTSRFLPEYHKELGLSSQVKENFSRIKPHLTGRTGLIVGYDSFYFLYKARVEDINCAVISSGMYWPKDHLSEMLTQLLNDGRVIFYDSNGDSHNRYKRENDLKRMVAEFELTPVENGLFKVSFKKADGKTSSAVNDAPKKASP